MSVFTGPLRIEEIIPGKRWKLIDPIRFEAGAEGSGRWIEVPAGFVTDGATIPPALRFVLAVWGSYGRAAALHDYLYSILRAGNLTGCAPVTGADTLHPAFEAATDGYWPGCPMHEMHEWGREVADAQFYLAMRACGTRPALARVMWRAVRLFGAKAARPL